MRPHLGHRVLELGCGIGSLTPLLLREERSVLAIDIDARCIDAHRERVGKHPDLTVRRAAIQELPGDLADTFDSIVSSNVLEHIPDDEESAVVRAACTLLKPGGTTLHWVPACPRLFGSLDRVYGHQRRYTKARLRRLFENAGLSVDRCTYWNSVGVFGWWWQAKVRKAQRIPLRSALLFDRFCVPVLRRVEPYIWLPCGQSLLIRARKPAG
jgi:cyclopropane fatty-acyl-phospholipid synthase-like methyltransferase